MSIGFPSQPGGGAPSGGPGGGGFGGPGAPGGYAPPPPYQPPPSADLQATEPGPAPREVPPDAVGWNGSFKMMFGAGFGGIPLVIFVVTSLTMVMPHEDWILDYRGEQATAQATAAHATNTSVNDESVYDVDVSYTDKQGQQRRGSVSTTNSRVIYAGNMKKPLKIEYDPQKPSRVRVVGESASAIGFLGYIPLFFALIGVPTFLAGVSSARKHRRLYRHGTPAQARVQRITASASSENDETVMIAHYSYQALGGVYEGELKSVSPPKLGSVIWVLFDPKNPARSIAA